MTNADTAPIGTLRVKPSHVKHVGGSGTVHLEYRIGQLHGWSNRWQYAGEVSANDADKWIGRNVNDLTGK